MKVAPLLLFLFTSLQIATAFAQKAFLESNTILEGDVAILFVEYTDDTPSMYSLDTSPLDQSFEVLSVKPKVERRHESNKVIHVQHWEVALSPKVKGVIKIPSLKIKQSSTPELTLEVINSTVGESSDEKIWIEVNADSEKPFVGEQVIFTIRLISNRPLLSGLLREPRLEQARVLHLGIDETYVQTINGESFNVLQRKLALFANRSGELIFPSVRFFGKIDVLNKNGQPRQILRQSNTLTLSILKPPSTYSNNDWLPMTELEISEQWSHLDRNLQVGDSVSRTISLRTTGLPSDILPNNLFESGGSNLVVYPDKAKRGNEIVDGNIVGWLDQTYAIVLTEQGNIQIPNVTLDWWDVDDNQQKTIILPGRILVVAAASILSTSETNHPVGLLRWLVGGFLFLLTIVSLYKWSSGRSGDSSRRFSKKQFKHACLNEEALKSRALLIMWAREQWPEESIVGLSDLKIRIGSGEFNLMLEKLDRAIYAPNTSRWQGSQLWESFVDLKIQKYYKSALQQGLLPCLYPSE